MKGFLMFFLDLVSGVFSEMFFFFLIIYIYRLRKKYLIFVVDALSVYSVSSKLQKILIHKLLEFIFTFFKIQCFG